MNSDEIRDKIYEIIVKQLEVEKDKLTPETKYAEDLGADSLDTAELVMLFEDEFQINVSDDAEGKIKTIGDTVAYIAEQLQSKEG